MQKQEKIRKKTWQPKAWKKGQSGNPDGRPKKGYSITEWFQQMLNSRPEVKDAIGQSILKRALEGDIAAQKLVWNYMDGLPPQPLRVSGDPDNGTPIQVITGVPLPHADSHDGIPAEGWAV